MTKTIILTACRLQLEPSGGMHPIDASTAVKPSLRSTWFVALIETLYRKVTGKKDRVSVPETPSANGEFKGNGSAPDVDSDDDSSTTGSEAPGSGASTPRRNGESTARLGPTSKAGGMRRKAVRRK